VVDRGENERQGQLEVGRREGGKEGRREGGKEGRKEESPALAQRLVFGGCRGKEGGDGRDSEEGKKSWGG
jgi:hypothetical protein